MRPPILLAVPNVSEGRDDATIAAIQQAFDYAGPPGTAANGVRLLDIHRDPDHHRSVFTLAGPPGRLGDALLSGARVAVERIDVVARAGGDPSQTGQHPHVGAIDVVPIVYLDPQARGAACAQALVIADRIGYELEVPVFLYGELSVTDAGSPRTRAQLRRGGVGALATRMAPTGAAVGHMHGPLGSESEEPLRSDFGPPRIHPTAGATLVAARPPLVAFNIQLASPGTVADARGIAALVREGGAEGLPGVRAIGVALSGGVAQVSMNVDRPFDVSLAMVVQAVAKHHQLAGAELVGLAPRAALEDFPEDIPMLGFDPARHVIENALGS